MIPETSQAPGISSQVGAQLELSRLNEGDPLTHLQSCQKLGYCERV